MVVPTLRGREWMHSFRWKRIRNIEFLGFHVLRKFWSFYALRALSPCCSLPFDEATKYGAPHTQRKGMDAFVSLKKNPKHWVPWFSRFVLVLLVLHSEDLFTLFFSLFRRGHTLWCSPNSAEGNGCIRFVEKESETLSSLVFTFYASFGHFTLWGPCHHVVHFLSTRPHTMVLPTLRGREWMPLFPWKRIRNIEFLGFHVSC